MKKKLVSDKNSDVIDIHYYYNIINSDMIQEDITGDLDLLDIFR